MAKVKTRHAEARDLDAVAELFDAYRQFYEKPADLALARRYLTERFQRKESVVIVAENSEGADRRLHATLPGVLLRARRSHFHAVRPLRRAQRRAARAPVAHSWRLLKLTRASQAPHASSCRRRRRTRSGSRSTNPATGSETSSSTTTRRAWPRRSRANTRTSGPRARAPAIPARAATRNVATARSSCCRSAG